MNSFGRSVLLGSLVLVLTGVPATMAQASSDVSGSVRAVAERAAELAAEEHDLLQISTASNLEAVERDEIEARILVVDAEGADLLGQLDRLDVDVTEAIRISLGELASADDRAQQPDVFIPSPAVYEAAVDDLRRIAADPDSVTSSPSSANTSSFGLLAVAALALVALGAAALGNSLRRQPDAELDDAGWSDGLTGLANRRRLDLDLARHDEADLPTSAIMVEIDGFEDINETFGHELGDDVLRRVGESIAEQVRYDDVVYRYGDEEFCVLLPGASATDAEAVATRIVAAVRGVTLPDDGVVTVTVGVAASRPGDASGAVRQADEALATAKVQARAAI